MCTYNPRNKFNYIIILHCKTIALLHYLLFKLPIKLWLGHFFVIFTL